MGERVASRLVSREDQVVPGSVRVHPPTCGLDGVHFVELRSYSYLKGTLEVAESYHVSRLALIFPCHDSSMQSREYTFYVKHTVWLNRLDSATSHGQLKWVVVNLPNSCFYSWGSSNPDSPFAVSRIDAPENNVISLAIVLNLGRWAHPVPV